LREREHHLEPHREIVEEGEELGELCGVAGKLDEALGQRFGEG
jgi:hypothetical protein